MARPGRRTREPVNRPLSMFRRNSRIRLLYRFKTSVPIDRRLDFIQNAERTVAQTFDKNFDRAFDRAVATAR